MEILELRERNDLFEKAIHVFWKEWAARIIISFTKIV